MNENELKRLVKELSSFEQLKLQSIPDIDLYMDQVTTFIDEKLGYLKRNKEDNALTKTMINNYTKAGILMAPKKKKYSKQHMILIILTYYFKQILSINDIQSLLSPIVQSISSGENHNEDLDDIYSSFLEIEESEIESFVNSFDNKISFNSEEDSNREDKDINKLIMIVIMLVVKANIQKRMAEKIIDEFFK